MKKIIAVLLILSCISVFAACEKKTVDDGKALETAETYVEITGNSGSLSLDENVARTLLEVYQKESLGLSKDIYSYELKLSATRFLDSDACLVEAFPEEAEVPEGTFIILGQQCFVYDNKTREYLLLTAEGAVEFNSSEISATKEQASDTESAFEYDEDNNKNLQEKFSSYNKKQLGLDKELTEYVMIVPGTTTTAENGETVFVIRIYEKNGQATNYTLAFNENGNYIFDYEKNKYIKL